MYEKSKENLFLRVNQCSGKGAGDGGMQGEKRGEGGREREREGIEAKRILDEIKGSAH